MALDDARPRITGSPDIMNDSAFDVNVASGAKGLAGEADTCRICRGEGTQTEPLFYPCKCSGSIKFVHQECLMEWLSHSQKKHCELCKTPFRFTKLYHPQMPQSLPTSVFLRHVVTHGLSNIVTWARFLLVCFVWLAWLPWSMRTVWRFLFWIADGGWATWQPSGPRYAQLEALLTSRQTFLPSSATISTSPAPAASPSALSMSPTQDALRSGNAPASLLAPFSQLLNRSAGDSTAYETAKGLLMAMVDWSSNTTSAASDMMIPGARQQHPPLSRHDSSFFSDVPLLSNLTRSPKLNNLIIDVLEGQLITISIVVAFILIFLIREWVVQQQPGIQLEPEFNAAFVPGPRAEAHHPERGPAAQPAEPGFDGEPDQRRFDDDEPRETNDDPLRRRDQVDAPGLADREAAHHDGGGPRHARARPMARARRRVHFPPDEEIQSDIGSPTAPAQDEGTGSLKNRNPRNRLERARSEGDLATLQSGSEVGFDLGHQRPTLPTRDALSRAAEIQRTIEEEHRHRGRDWPLQTFMDIWNRAERKPREVIRIIEAENRTEELGWIVEVMKRRLVPAANAPSSPMADSATSHAPSPAILGPGISDTIDFTPRPFTSESNESSPDALGRSTSGEEWEEWRDGDGLPFSAPSTQAVNGSIDPDDELARSATQDEVPQSALNSGVHVSKGKSRLHERRPPEGPSAKSAESSADAQQITPGTSPRANEHRAGHQSEQDQPRDEAWKSDSMVVPPVDEADSIVSLDSTGDSIPQETANPFHPNYEGDIPDTPGYQGPALDPDQAPRDANDAPPETQQVAQQGLYDRIMDRLWGGIAAENAGDDELHENDEHIVRNLADEPPFVAIAQEDEDVEHDGRRDVAGIADDGDLGGFGGVEPEDPDAIEDGEDFDGVMELIGMRGPLTGLFQNATFSAVLISATIAGALWLPYVWGKVVLVVLGHPLSLFVKLPLRLFSTSADLVVDLTLFFLGSFVHWTDLILRLLLRPLAFALPTVARFSHSSMIGDVSRSVAERGLERIAKIVVAVSLRFSESDYPIFSIVSHQALQTMKVQVSAGFGHVSGLIASAYHGPWTLSWPMAELRHFASQQNSVLRGSGRQLLLMIGSRAQQLLGVIVAPTRQNALRDLLDIPTRTTPIDPSLAYWGTWDRVIAVLAGYWFFSLLGALYLKKRTPFSSSEQGKRVEAIISDVLQQAGGVLKVILIISIEMIAFPLYCGMLLDLALLPLFDGATMVSRVRFTLSSPCTSIFVHWFVGTCYMFHFALFVSMCRRIMRSGVLYFIRDPDDPTFHPVRDVLERNVVTQLRKITFSALVYGGLVVVCLGGVVWGLYHTFSGVLPIYWSSNEPVLEFPVDLLFYNFLMPLAVKFFKPSEGLHAMYTWWFRKCARLLRLSWFLFGERREDEEGRHVRRTWWHLLSGKRGDFRKPVIGMDRKVLAEDRNMDAYFLRDGRYVRTPASDQVRIPKGANVFTEVDESEERALRNSVNEDGPHGQDSEQFTKVYIPPWFGVRISAFIFLIWIFAAITGVGITIVPLVFGRLVFATMVPQHLRMNDVYAFSIGIYMLGGLLYGALRYDRALAWLVRTLRLDAEAPTQALRRCYALAVRSAQLVYTYAAFGIVLPSLFALLMEFYVIIPIHTLVASDEKHMIHFIQDWTLGVLYIKMAGRMILWYSSSRPARALRAVTRRGWTNPDVRVATRCFILPASVMMVTGLVAPLPLGWMANRFYFHESSALLQSQVYRYSYPAVLTACVWTGCMFLLGMMFERWRRAIRDEVYLIGERLHNFGERRAGALATKATG
ncbi:MAG: hypothetical protein M1832_002666 [Thelocarpon impressellum]|nr:MAG: hypothetical protein M1832_002666 [Thelocarpon impressellum]